MSGVSRSISSRDFFLRACELSFLTDVDPDELAQRADASNLPLAEFAFSEGLLDATEIDIVETLLAPEELVPGYRVLGLIGRGGMGIVYRAEQLALRREVALKTINVGRSSDRTIVDRFEQEARMCGQLRHPNIVAAYDFGRSRGRVFLAMELVEGTDLERRIREQGPLDEPTAWGLARQVAAGLSHAAERGIVHRDIKPANLMLVDPPEGFPLPKGLPMVKITDFGLALLQQDAEVHTRLTSQNATLGSPHYMAPEQLESSGVDKRADIYALGATLYHALTGSPPFKGLNLSQLIAAKLNGLPHPLSAQDPGLSHETCDLVTRMLARDREERPPGYTSLLAEIDRVLESLESTTVRFPAEFSDDSARDRPLPDTQDPIETISDLPGRRALSRWQLPRSGVAAIAGGVLLTLAALLAWMFNQPDRVGAPTLSPFELAGEARPLFAGRSLNGWHIRSGSWMPQNSRLVGQQGVIVRPLSRPVGATDGRWYRLELLLAGLEESDVATVAEVHFGLAADQSGDGSRYVLQRTVDGVRLGRREGDSQPWKPVPTIEPLDHPASAVLAVRIDRLPEGWGITINDEPLAVVPHASEPEVAELRLRAENGPVAFSDLVWTALRIR